MAKSKFEMAIDGLHQMGYYWNQELIEAMNRGYVIQPTYQENNPLFQNPEYLRIYKAKHPEYGRVPASKYSQSNLDEVTRILKAFGLTWREFIDYVRCYDRSIGMFVYSDFSCSFTRLTNKTAIGVIAGCDDYGLEMCAINWRKEKAYCSEHWDRREREWCRIYNDYELQQEFTRFSTPGTNSKSWDIPSNTSLLDFSSRPEFRSFVLSRLGKIPFANVLSYGKAGFGFFTPGVGHTIFRDGGGDWSKDVLFLPCRRLPPKQLGKW